MARHTPGPWEALPSGTVCTADTGQIVADPYAGGLGAWRSRAQMEADGHLIAAAPAMLAMLLDLEWSGTTDLPDGGTGACCPECEGIAPGVRLPGWAQDYHGHAADCRILAVIGRATGEEVPHG